MIHWVPSGMHISLREACSRGAPSDRMYAFRRLTGKRLAVSGATGGLAGGVVACGVFLLGAVALLACRVSGRAPE